MEKSYEALKKTEDKHGEIEFQAQLPLAILEKGMLAALEESARDFELPGFRKGKVPAHMIRDRVDEMQLLETAADGALRDAIREILADEKLSIVGSPQLTIMKVALKNPVEFKVRFALFPEIKLPDYKHIGHEIAAREDSVEVTETEMNEAIERLLKMMASQQGVTDATHLTTLTDDMVKMFGPFQNVEEFKAKLKENLAQEKTINAKENKREEIIREIVKQAKMELPKMLVDQEWYTFEERRNAELEEAGLTLEAYLEQVKKTAKDLEKEERALIEERLKTSLVFREIQKAENVVAEEKEIQTNIAYLKLRYPDRSEPSLRETAEAIIIQEKIFDVLGLPIRPETR